MRAKKSPLGAILVRQRAIDEARLTEALAYQSRYGCRIGEALIKLGFCTDVQVMRAVAEQVDMPFVDLDEDPPSTRVLRLIPRETAREWGMIAAREEAGRVVVVARNPFDFRVDEAARHAVGGPITVAFGVESQIQRTLERYDNLRAWELRERYDPVMPQRDDRYQLKEWTLDLAQGDPKTEEIVDRIIREALERGATEVHFEPKQGMLYVSVRVNEDMVPLGAFPHSQIRAILNRVKTLCGMNLRDQFHGQEGLYTLAHEGQEIEFKATTRPMLPFEGMYLKREVRETRIPTLEELWFSPAHERALNDMMAARKGLLLVAGPAGAGTGVTLFALGSLVDTAARRVSVISNGVSPELAGAELVDYSRTFGLSCSGAIRTALERQSEVLIVPDLPDFASIGAIFRAADHALVVAALEAEHVLDRFPEWEEGGLAPRWFLPKMVGGLTQWLARRVCEKCAVEYHPEPEALLEWGEDLTSYSGATFRRGRGCERCLFRGYRGRVGVYELLNRSDLGSFLNEEGELKPSASLHTAGWQTLRSDAAWKARRGILCPDEAGHLGLGGRRPQVVA